jgi:ligand-binding sensor domain-containing protein
VVLGLLLVGLLMVLPVVLVVSAATGYVGSVSLRLARGMWEEQEEEEQMVHHPIVDGYSVINRH